MTWIAEVAKSQRMPHILFRLAFAAVICSWLGSAAAEVPPNTLTEPERRAGWRLLFDGRSTDGFRGYRRDHVPQGWAVEDGALVRHADGAGDLLTHDTFEHFELVLEYRIAPGGNSGVMFHVTEQAQAPWMSGPEVQIIDNAAGASRQKAGWLYELYEPKKPSWLVDVEIKAGKPRQEWLDATRPAGEWNHLYLRVSPGSGEVCVNGVSYLKFCKGDEEWAKRVAASKFKAFPDFGKEPRGHVCLQDHGDEVAFRSIKVRKLDAHGRPIGAAAETALPLKPVPAFPGIDWEGWSPESDDGIPANPLRPLTVTHAGDGSGRRFILDQSGMIHVVPRELPAEKPRARLFLDIRTKTAPWRKADEEGLLGLAFHPRFRETGEFFICYCLAGEPRIERISRFRVAADSPDRADPASEEVLLEFEQPLPNHNGGSLAFGPDGFLYAGIGDGGGRDDPLHSAQRLDTLLGKILRIDVDRRDAARGFAAPSDNPFVNRPDARPEIFAFGFRNPWQIAIDRQTGQVWAADVGQDLREEIDMVEKGGNYGWSLQEGSGPFGSVIARTPTIDPVWEYDHRIGKSITGGFVVRGSPLAALEGGYLYGDYVAGKLWLLRPHGDPRRIVNDSVPWNGLPVFGFGQDEAGEVYVLSSSPTGQGVFRLVADEPDRDGAQRRDPAVNAAHGAARKPGSPPSVVVILADDAGYGDVSFVGNRNLATPAIDSLARDGAVLRQFMVQPFCSPTRAEFLTGRCYPRTGVLGVQGGAERIAADELTIAEVFGRAGYATGCFGKWHNGTQWPFHPRARGFDRFYGFTEGHWAEYFSPLLSDGTHFVRGQGYITDDLTTQAIAFIRAAHAAGQPFFCYVPYNTPHSPMCVPDDAWRRVESRPLADRGPDGDREDLPMTRAALAMVEHMDGNIGRILATLDDLGITRDTVVVMFSDNGPNSRRWNAGLRGIKGSTDDGGCRSICCIRHPERITAGTTVAAVTGAIDLLPTLTDLCGLELAPRKPLDGLSIAPLLNGDAGDGDAGHGELTRRLGTRAIVSRRGDMVSVRTSRHRLDHEGRLYDMLADPGQTRDLSAAAPEEAARLAALAETYRRDVMGSVPDVARSPFPVGWPGAPLTELPAGEGIARGGIARSSNATNSSYFTRWTSTDDAIEWPVEVVRAGCYNVELWYTVPEADAGATIEVACGTGKLVATVGPGWNPPLKTGEDRVPRGESYDKDFQPLRLGAIELAAGTAPLRLRATAIPGATVADVRRLVLIPAETAAR